MPGGDLDGMLARFGALAPARAAEVACAVLSALAAGHAMGVLHRAVKPTNVLFDAVGGARLGDFGSSQLGDVAATVTTALSRTLAYVAPELRQGRAPTERSDIFSVGVMLHEMLTGIAPDPHLPMLPLASQVHPGLDARHDRALAHLTAVDPADRPDGAREALAMLAQLAWAGPGVGRAQAGGNAEASWRDEADRVCAATGGAPFEAFDAWIARGVERVPCTPAILARARAFARAGDPGLQAIWRIDAASETLWLEPLGPRLDRPLSEGERESLRRALDALHAAGAVHGSVGPEGVGRGAQGWALRFGGEPHPHAGVDEDRAALAALWPYLSSTIG
jgi:serine/threonine-protein kinase